MLKISIEGRQGSGKTTVAGILAEALTKAGYLVESGEHVLVTQIPNTFADARKEIGTMPRSISGSGGHAALFAVARRLVQDFALSDADAWNLLLEYNKRCEPPWSEQELRHKLESARA